MVDGATATESGLLMLPMMGGVVLASTVSGQLISPHRALQGLPRAGLRPLDAGDVAAVPAGDGHRPRWTYSVWMAVLGLGIGLVLPVLVLAVQNSVPVRDLGTATSANNYFRQIGGSVGAAVFGTLFIRAARRLPGTRTCRATGRGGSPDLDSLTPQTGARDARSAA